MVYKERAEISVVGYWHVPPMRQSWDFFFERPTHPHLIITDHKKTPMLFPLMNIFTKQQLRRQENEQFFPFAKFIILAIHHIWGDDHKMIRSMVCQHLDSVEQMRWICAVLAYAIL